MKDLIRNTLDCVNKLCMELIDFDVEIWFRPKE